MASLCISVSKQITPAVVTVTEYYGGWIVGLINKCEFRLLICLDVISCVTVVLRSALAATNILWHLARWNSLGAYYVVGKFYQNTNNGFTEKKRQFVIGWITLRNETDSLIGYVSTLCAFQVIYIPEWHDKTLVNFEKMGFRYDAFVAYLNVSLFSRCFCWETEKNQDMP
jgi:hypothetical protein